MELKKYQKRVIDDLNDYLNFLASTQSLSRAYSEYWEARHVTVGSKASPVQEYQNTIPSVPNICYKVPTGGGKTFLAAASVKPIFDYLPSNAARVLVWLVPSEAILTQTLQSLKDPHHPYRRRLNTDFGGRVEVYSKDELLAGQSFSPTIIADQLSVMVLSYDSLRSKKKDGRKVYQENGNLTSFSTFLGSPERPIENAAEGSLAQYINQLNPVVIVDESHHATSSLSREMLTNLNPSFILDLTATPKEGANVISYVSASELKLENMVKLPVVAYNRTSKEEVITDAIDLRCSLEKIAKEAQKQGGRYIRPIVLFQAEPRHKEDVTSFEKLREKLIAAGIPKEEIAIKTAQKDELKNVNLLSEECQIRYIITVNALKEGWDCSFAYILASVANRTSRVDVEQILGRVLRQPYAKVQSKGVLNMSYVLTSSNNFSETIRQIIAGLNAAGFTKRDYRIADDEGQLDLENVTDKISAEEAETPEQFSLLSVSDSGEDATTEEFLDFDESLVSVAVEERAVETSLSNIDTHEVEGDSYSLPSKNVLEMLNQAEEQESSYQQDIQKIANNVEVSFMEYSGEDSVKSYSVNEKFRDDISSLRIPQFFIKSEESDLFNLGNGDYDLLQKESLNAGFNLLTKDTSINLGAVDEEMYLIDVKDQADTPVTSRLGREAQQMMREHFMNMSDEGKRYEAIEQIYQRVVKRINEIPDSQLKKYIERIVEGFSAEDMLFYYENSHKIAEQVYAKIKRLLEEHRIEKFNTDLETESISVRESYALPDLIFPKETVTYGISKSLYEEEGKMNNLEMRCAERFSGLDNVKWWHRNIERKGFCINGPINHYPDFIVETNNGHIVMVETKGAHLKNEESAQKLKLGKRWADKAGETYRYYMVFDEGDVPMDGAYEMSKFLEILQRL
ncbi:DEAD/DEAH box helicase family protein [uncultured Rothia sp.]|uniref:DEAD/DEAH box helicase n=1 Tax=uncultured Rothia sp. TaxID=316088 RepID=UPI0028EFD2FF|nr:DEAD/DEAH box helicase family protein [uncultured Rothia sp.]